MKWFHTKWLFSFCVIVLDSAWVTEKKKTHYFGRGIKMGERKKHIFFFSHKK